VPEPKDSFSWHFPSLGPTFPYLLRQQHQTADVPGIKTASRRSFFGNVGVVGLKIPGKKRQLLVKDHDVNEAVPPDPSDQPLREPTSRNRAIRMTSL
jgi:hypothetical protein